MTENEKLARIALKEAQSVLIHSQSVTTGSSKRFYGSPLKSIEKALAAIGEPTPLDFVHKSTTESLLDPQFGFFCGVTDEPPKYELMIGSFSWENVDCPECLKKKP